MKKYPTHEARGCSVYVGRVEVARFNDHYQAQRFAERVNDQEKKEDRND